jgi:hypothetical protein
MSDSVVSIVGTISPFEGMRFAGAIRRRVFGRWGIAWFALVALVAAVAMAAALVITRLKFKDELIVPAIWVGYAVLVVASVLACNRIAAIATVRAWSARGVPPELSITYSVDAEGLRMSSETGMSLVRWAALNEVALEGDYWLLFGSCTAYFLPRRLFGTPVQERAFLAALSEGLEPAARERSSKLYSFLSSPASTR